MQVGTFQCCFQPRVHVYYRYFEVNLVHVETIKINTCTGTCTVQACSCILVRLYVHAPVHVGFVGTVLLYQYYFSTWYVACYRLTTGNLYFQVIFVYRYMY